MITVVTEHCPFAQYARKLSKNASIQWKLQNLARKSVNNGYKVHITWVSADRP
jgi:hypothetical protein